MSKKTTYEELKQKIKELEREAFILKRTEVVLRESQEKYKQLIEQLSDVVLTVKLGGRLSYLSPAIKGFGGYDPDEEVGNHIAKYFVNKKELIKTLKVIKKIYIDKKPASIEFLFKPLDRDFFYVEVTGRPLIIENKVKNIHCVMRNITDRRQAEAALRESESRYSALFNGITDAVFVHHITEDGGPGQIIDANDVACKMLGYTRDELIGMGIGDIDAPKSTVDVHRVVENLKAGRGVLFEQLHVTKDGKRIPVEVHTRTFDYQGRLAILSTVRDITERKRDEEQIKAEREKLISIFDSIDEVIYVADPETYELLYMNEAFRKNWGDGVGQKCHYVLQNRHSPCPFCTNDHIFGKNFGQPYIWEFQNTVNGRWYRCIDKAISWPDGRMVRYELAVDIHDRKQAEEERLKLETQLQQAQKMESLGVLAGGIAHDFNNVLYSIIGYTELTMDDVPEGSVAQKNLKEVFKGAMRAKDMVQQILAFSRKAETIKKPIKLQSVVREAIKLLRTSIPSTIEIRQNIDANCSPAFADSTQIHQVVMNLSTNAYQAMREKGGVLELTLMEEEISSSDSNLDLMQGKYLKLIVSDTGYGIDRVLIDKIFDPYFTTRGLDEGTGMGLAVVHGIVKSHGGDIKVYSELGKGTIFHVYFPIAETIPVEPKVISAEPAPRGTERILFVDDEQPIVSMAHQILERLGYQVTPRTSSVEALEAFRAKPDAFDLVITDMTMPNMTGIELTSGLKGIRPDIPIIICTGFSEMIDGNKAKSMGILGYIMKPIDKDEIARTIRKVLDEMQET